MAIYRGAGGAGDATSDAASEALLIKQLAVDVQADADAAEAARLAAVAAKNAAELAETNAEIAETNAETAETNAETAASNASSSASAASTSATNAASSASSASTSATNAASSATAASGSAGAASTSATNAASSASSASASASTATTQATNASNSATAAASSASTATTQATNASNSASAAATSATNAASSATSASNSATTATTQAGIATTQATNSANSATASATSATNSANSATAAAGSATNASNSASAASTSATNASNSASAASSSASSAASSLLAVQQVFDDFDDIYLGAKASDPTVDNDGDPLVAGAVYFNTTAEEVRFYNGAAWERPEYAASQSAIAAQSSATSASNSASAASTSATNSANSASASLTSANNAATSETNAATSASAAATSATNASNSASSASTSATNASNSASAASTSATNAATSATNAANSATLAASYTPSQTGNSGKYLTTDGTNTSWDALAAVANSGAYSDLSGTPSLATVATTGAYSDLSGTPSLATVATSGSYNDLSNKPTIPTNLDSLTDVVITSPSNNQSLVYNGTNWVNAAGGSSQWVTTGSDIYYNTGNVGIGTTTVTDTLTVNGAGRFYNAYTENTTNIGVHVGYVSGSPRIGFFNGTAAQNWQIDNNSGEFRWFTPGVVRMALDASGNLRFNSGYGSVATAYGCRAWVNFNGTDTVAIRSSGNVSSITDLGTGSYQINFTTAMVDNKYCAVFGSDRTASASDNSLKQNESYAPTTSNIRVYQVGTSFADCAYGYVAIFR